MDRSQRILELINRNLPQKYRYDHIGLILGILFGLMISGVSFFPSMRENPFVFWFMQICGWIVALISISAFIGNRLNRKRELEIISEFTHNTGKIVWIYKIYDVIGFSPNREPVRSYVSVLTDRRNFTQFRMENDSEADELLELIRKSIPGITVGFSKDFVKDYSREPTQLRMNPRFSSDPMYRQVRS